MNHAPRSTWKGRGCCLNPRGVGASLVDGFQVKFSPDEATVTLDQNGQIPLVELREAGQTAPYLSNRCVRVEFMALSTVAIASSMDVATKGSPFRLTSGTRRTRSCWLPGPGTRSQRLDATSSRQRHTSPRALFLTPELNSLHHKLLLPNSVGITDFSLVESHYTF